MKVRDIAAVIEAFAPLSLQESYDNAGLIVGRMDDEVQKALLAVDVTEEVIAEAVAEGCDMIITHHPIIFHAATHLDGLKKVCIVGGGVGCAIAMPIAEALHEMGANVTSIIGFRNKDLLILEDEFKACSDTLRVMTDDGSYGEHGNVTVPLKEMLDAGEKFDMIITIGPLIMMKFVTLTAKPYGTPVTVSMNPIMIDGTGMCGGCRLTLNVDGKKVTKFACVDGPDFNGYEVDFDEAMSRGRMYFDFERHAHEETCNLFKKEVQ